MQRESSTLPVLLTITLIVALCCLAICVVIFASGTLFLNWRDSALITSTSQELIMPTETIIAEGPTATEESNQTLDPTPTKESAKAVPDLIASTTLMKLEQEIVPINDPIDLAERLGGKTDIPEVLLDLNAPYNNGDSKDFWVTNVDTNENFLISTTLRYLGDNVYIWIENGVEYEPKDLQMLGDTFDNEIYGINRDFFGSEWSPGVDGDPRIYIVYAGGLGQSLAGYYSSADQLHPDAHEYSNAHEIFLINSDNVYLWEEYIYGTLAHEFQHMIHWYTDKNEETWLNEGFSMLAELINNFDPGGFDYAYIANPDLQLTDWGTDIGRNGPHYGASFLFTTYLLDKFGDEATKAIVENDKNGMESIDHVLTELDIRDSVTGKPISAEDIFADWAVTNYLGDPDVADGRYFYAIYPYAPLADPTVSFPICPVESSTYDVAQFGVDYLDIFCRGEYQMIFEGNTISSILPTDPYSGEYFFWSNMGDHSNMSLQRAFDLSGLAGPVEMTYQTWYDLENDYDYVFVSASTDGMDWQLLNSTTCTFDNPSGNSYGCGLNGQSNSWQEEQVDLSKFAGQEVTVRFDYVTDAAVNGLGMVIDDVRIDALDYFTDFESDDGGWEGEGFVRIQNVLPQTFQLSLITYGAEILVDRIELDPDNRASIDLDIGRDVDSVVLVVSGTTPFTRQRADYQITIESKR